MSKQCTKCNTIKDDNDFYKTKHNKDGLMSQCKTCFKITQHDIYDKNKEKIRLRQKIYREKNKDIIKTYKQEYYQNNKEYKKELNKKYYHTIKKYDLKQKEKAKKYNKEYQRKHQYRDDPIHRLISNQRSRINKILKHYKNEHHMLDRIGCTPAELKIHLESQFTEGMTWDNYGKWHVDHIIPCASFDLTDLEQQKKCFHYTNLQPLWAKDNLAKGDKLDYILDIK